MPINSPYCTLDQVKSRLLPAGAVSSAYDATLTDLIDAASRMIDRWCQRRPGAFVPTAGVRVYDVLPEENGPVRTHRDASLGLGGGFTIGVPDSTISVLDLDPLLEVDRVATDEDGDGTFETVWSPVGAPPDYELLPRNAPLDGEPYRQIRTHLSAVRRFPIGESRLQISGTWGESLGVPGPIVEATTTLVIRWFKRAQDPLGGHSTSLGGAIVHAISVIPDPDLLSILERGNYVDYWHIA